MRAFYWLVGFRKRGSRASVLFLMVPSRKLKGVYEGLMFGMVGLMRVGFMKIF